MFDNQVDDPCLLCISVLLNQTLSSSCCLFYNGSLVFNASICFVFVMLYCLGMSMLVSKERRKKHKSVVKPATIQTHEININNDIKQ